MKKFTYLLLITCLTTTIGCQKAYYKTMETFGYHKRDILVERVEESRDAQEEAKEQFQSALEEFSSVVNFEGGELQAKYDKLKAELDRSEKKAQKVSQHQNDVGLDFNYGDLHLRTAALYLVQSSNCATGLCDITINPD